MSDFRTALDAARGTIGDFRGEQGRMTVGLPVFDPTVSEIYVRAHQQPKEQITDRMSQAAIIAAHVTSGALTKVADDVSISAPDVRAGRENGSVVRINQFVDTHLVPRG